MKGRKHKSQLQTHSKITPWNTHKHKSEVLGIETLSQIDLNIMTTEFIYKSIEKAIKQSEENKYIAKQIDFINAITFQLCQSSNPIPDCLSYPKPLLNREFSLEQPVKVVHSSKLPKNIHYNSVYKEDRQKINVQNQKQAVGKLKKEHLLKSRPGKQNHTAIKLELDSQEQDNSLLYERSTLRGIKKYTEKNLKIIDLAKNEAKIQGKCSKDEEYVLDIDAKPIKIRKQALQMIKSKTKKSILKTDITFKDSDIVSENKLEQLKLRKQPSFTYHSNTKASLVANAHLPTVQQVQASLQNSVHVAKGVSIKEKQHKFLTRVSKFNNFSAHNFGHGDTKKNIQREKNDKLPSLSTSKRNKN